MNFFSLHLCFQTCDVNLIILIGSVRVWWRKWNHSLCLKPKEKYQFFLKDPFFCFLGLYSKISKWSEIFLVFSNIYTYWKTCVWISKNMCHSKTNWNFFSVYFQTFCVYVFFYSAPICYDENRLQINFRLWRNQKFFFIKSRPNMSDRPWFFLNLAIGCIFFGGLECVWLRNNSTKILHRWSIFCTHSTHSSH